MTLGELTVGISVDDSSARSGLDRVRTGLDSVNHLLGDFSVEVRQSFEGMASLGMAGQQNIGRLSAGLKNQTQALRDYRAMLVQVREQTVLGHSASESQLTLYRAMTGIYGNLSQAQIRELAHRLAVRDSLNQERDLRMRVADSVGHERRARLEALAVSEQDRASLQVFGKLFDGLTDAQHRQLAIQLAVQMEATRSAKELRALREETAKYRHEAEALGLSGISQVALESTGRAFATLSAKSQAAVRDLMSAKDALSAAQLSGESGGLLRRLASANASTGEKLYADRSGDSRAFSDLPVRLQSAWQQLANSLTEMARNARLQQVRGQTDSLRRQRQTLLGVREVPDEWTDGMRASESEALDGLDRARKSLVDTQSARAAATELRNLRAQLDGLTQGSKESDVASKLFGRDLQDLTWWQRAYAQAIGSAQNELAKKRPDQRRIADFDHELVRLQAQQISQLAKLSGHAVGASTALKLMKSQWAELGSDRKYRLESILKVQSVLDTLEQVTDGVRRMFDRVFSDLWNHGFKGFFRNVLSGFDQLLREMAMEWAKAQVMRGLGGLIGTIAGGLGVSVSSSAAATVGGESVWGGGFATGGLLSANTPYLVGEEGPELFVPASSGVVTPNHQLTTGGITLNSTINIHTPNVESFRRSLGQVAYETQVTLQRAARRHA